MPTLEDLARDYASAATKVRMLLEIQRATEARRDQGQSKLDSVNAELTAAQAEERRAKVALKAEVNRGDPAK